MSPSAGPGNTATMLAWQNARDKYRKSLPDKDFKRIMIPAGPEDVLKEVEKWQSRQRKSKYCRVADGVVAGMSRLQKFSRAIDMIAQGSPAPGCLVWGSIIFVLTIVQDAAEEYNKLCKTLYHMIECLPRVELYTETFLDSILVQGCVNDFYSSVLRFWTSACKFYRRGRLFNFFRVVWNDYDAEFGELETNMVRCRDRVEASALAEHIGESKVARIQQKSANTSLLETQSSSRQKGLIAWLAPARYSVDYYMEDFANAKATRHAKTCQWLLNKDAFVQFSQTTARGGAFLWIYAQPGAGKTVLAAFIVDYCAPRQQSGCVLFFFCKDTDEDKRTPVAVARSLLYQLFHALRERAVVSALIDEISLAMDESGQKRALNFSALWKIFSNHISALTPATIIVDALDECRDSEILIQGLRSMASSCNVAVILTSRKEEHLYQLLHESPSLEVLPDDIDADIKAFVEAKVAASPRLSQPSVKHLVVRRLCESHGGMFLWVQYMVKELKSCVSLQQVQEELRELPKGLDAVYERILQRLQETLDRQTFKLCSKVLTWVTTAIRPLKIEELKQALESHYLNEGHSLLSTDGSFPYSDKDIELVCGSLVAVRNETLQVVHLTVKQYIISADLTKLRLLAATKGASSQLTLACLGFLERKCAKPIAKVFPKRPIGAYKDKLNLSLLRSENPFLEYACFSWLVHFVDCTNIDALDVYRAFYRTFDSPSTFGWIESCMTLQPDSVPSLLMGLEDVRDWMDNLQLDGGLTEDSNFAFVSSWCATMEQVLEEYSPVIMKRTTDIYYLDLALAFGAYGLTNTYEKHGGLARREKCSRFPTDRIRCAARENVPTSRQLKISSEVNDDRLDLFIHEPNRDVFIWSHSWLQNDQHVLFAQSASSGRRLPPMSSSKIRPSLAQDVRIKSYAMSKDGRFLGIVYSDDLLCQSVLIWEIEVTLDFTRRMRASPWARLVHRSETEISPYPDFWSDPCIAFDHDGVCFTPSGLFRTASGANVFIQGNLIQLLLTTDDRAYMDIQRVFYSMDGNFLFVTSTTTITKYTFPSLEVSFQLPLSNEKREVLMASPSGRYLAFVAGDLVPGASDQAEALNSILLVDTLLDNNIVLLDYPDAGETRWKQVLHFSVDEREVVAFSFCGQPDSTALSHLRICHYSGLPDAIWLRASGKGAYEAFLTPRNLCVSSDSRTANLVTSSGEVQRIALGDEIKFLDQPDEAQELPSRSEFLSQDGCRWATVYFGTDKAQIQIRTVLYSDEPTRDVELQRTPRLGDDWPKFTTMSMDLSILVLDGDIYRVRDSKSGQLLVAAQTLELPRKLAVSQSAKKFWPAKCLVDHTNSYVACVRRTRGAIDPHCPDVLALFRIDHDKPSSPRLQLPLPEDMFGISTQFHPSLPLLMLGFGLHSEISARKHEAKDIVLEVAQFQFHVLLIDMRTMSTCAVDIAQEQDICADSRFWYIRAPLSVAFSSSGDFAYVRNAWRIKMIKDNIEVSPTSHHRYIESSLAVDGAYYTIDSPGRCSTIPLSLTRLTPTKWSVAKKSVGLPNLVSLSSTLASKRKAFLLLGRTDEDQMHVLLVPTFDNECAAEVKTIPLTWAEARAKLDQMWEEKWGCEGSSPG